MKPEDFMSPEVRELSALLVRIRNLIHQANVILAGPPLSPEKRADVLKHRHHLCRHEPDLVDAIMKAVG